jgi:N-acetylglutamate synthase-like GNAT family acetyltransferase
MAKHHTSAAMQPATVELAPVQSAGQKSTARALILEYLNWIAPVAENNYGLSFDIRAMVASDIEDSTKFYPPRGRFYLVMHQGQAVGVGCLKQLAPGVGEVQRMYVQPHMRGVGAGRMLVERLIADARQLGFRSLRLESLKALDAAHALYHSVGFVDIDPYSENSMRTYQPPETLEQYRKSAVFMELALDPSAE